MTQGGQQSVEEAINRMVPMLILPVYGDQFANALRVERLGIGLQLPLSKLESSLFVGSIEEIINNNT